MVSRQRTSTFCNDIRMRNTVLIAGIYQDGNRVVHILLNGIVHTTFAGRRTCTVIIHTQTTADIDKLHLESQLMKLHIKLRSLTQSRLDTTYLGNLTADMEMNQLQAILQIFLLDKIKRFEQFAGSQSKLTGVATAFLPFAASRRSQFDADTDVGTYVQLFGHTGNEAQFVQLFHDQEHPFTHLLSQQCQFDVTLIFIPVADNQRIGISVDTDNGMKFRLRTGLQTQVEFLSMADNLLYNRTHLVHLDRIDDKVLGLIAILFGCLFETIGYLFNPVIQYIREAYQHGGCYIPQLQFVDQFFQVDLYPVFTGSYHYMTFVINTKVGDTPPRNVVEFFRIFNTPFSHFTT